MRPYAVASSLLAIASLVGCAVQHHPAALPEPANSDVARKQFSTWRVGVREPTVRFIGFDDPIQSGMSQEIEAAAHLIGRLRQTKLFSEVDFTGQLQCPPNLEVVALSGRGDGSAIDPFFPALLTGSLAITSEDGVAFAIVRSTREVFDLPYRTTLVIGVLSAVVSPVLVTGLFSEWDAFGDGILGDLERYLLANTERLARYATAQGDVVCTTTE